MTNEGFDCQCVECKEYFRRDDDQRFIRNLESRHMSSWSEAEMTQYNRLTGQEPEFDRINHGPFEHPVSE